MEFFLLWLETLAVALLFCAMMLACSSRLRSNRLRRLFDVCAVGLPFLILLMATLLLVGVRARSQGYGPSPVGLGSLTVVFAIGAWIIRRRAARESNSGPAAREWPVSYLALGFIGGGLLQLMTLQNLDENVRDWLANVQVEAGAMALAVEAPMVPDRDNAALLYEEIGRAAESSTTSGWLTDHGYLENDAGSEADWSSPDLVAVLAESESIIAAVRHAAEYPAYRLDRPTALSHFSNPTRPDLLPMLLASRIVVVDARYRARNDEVSAAVGGLAALHGVTRHAADLRLMISAMIATGVEKYAADALSDVLAMPGLAVEDLDRLELDPSMSHRRATVRAIRVEEASLLALYGQIAVEPGMLYGSLGIGGVPGPRPGLSSLYRIFFLRDDINRFRLGMAGVYRVCMESHSRIREHCDRTRSVPGRRTASIGGHFALNAASSILGALRGDAWRQLSRLAMAIRRQELITGESLQSLDDLESETITLLPGDPYSSKPLLFKRAEHGWFVYSVGENEDDDGGEGDDLVIRVRPR